MVEFRKPFMRANPKETFPVCIHGHHRVANQTLGIIGDVFVVSKGPCFPIESIQAALRADPEETVLIFGNRPDGAVAEAIGIIRIAQVTRELSSVTIQFVESFHRPHPHHPGPVLIYCSYNIVAQTVRIIRFV